MFFFTTLLYYKILPILNMIFILCLSLYTLSLINFRQYYSKNEQINIKLKEESFLYLKIIYTCLLIRIIAGFNYYKFQNEQNKLIKNLISSILLFFCLLFYWDFFINYFLRSLKYGEIEYDSNPELDSIIKFSFGFFITLFYFENISKK